VGIGTCGAKTSLEALLGREIAPLMKEIGLSQEVLGFRAKVHRTYYQPARAGVEITDPQRCVEAVKGIKNVCKQIGSHC
jgi:hypothetical protein